MAEVVQLRNQAISINMDKIPNYSVAELKELQILKEALIKFVKSPSNEKLKLLTNKYKKTFKDTEKMENIMKKCIECEYHKERTYVLIYQIAFDTKQDYIIGEEN